jgi:hypothetical protein
LPLSTTYGNQQAKLAKEDEEEKKKKRKRGVTWRTSVVCRACHHYCTHVMIEPTNDKDFYFIFLKFKFASTFAS